MIRGTEYSWYLTLIVPAFAAYYGGTFVFNNFIKGKEKDEAGGGGDGERPPLPQKDPPASPLHSKTASAALEPAAVPVPKAGSRGAALAAAAAAGGDGRTTRGKK